MERQLKEIRDFSKLPVAERIKMISAWNAMIFNIRKPTRKDLKEFWSLKRGNI